MLLGLQWPTASVLLGVVDRALGHASFQECSTPRSAVLDGRDLVVAQECRPELDGLAFLPEKRNSVISESLLPNFRDADCLSTQEDLARSLFYRTSETNCCAHKKGL